MIEMAAVLESAGPTGVAVLILYWQVEKLSRRVRDVEWAVYKGDPRTLRYRRVKRR